MSRIDPDRIPVLDEIIEPGDPAAIELGRRIRETILTQAEPGAVATADIGLNRSELEAIVDRHLDAMRRDLLDALQVWLAGDAEPD